MDFHLVFHLVFSMFEKMQQWTLIGLFHLVYFMLFKREANILMNVS